MDSYQQKKEGGREAKEMAMALRLVQSGNRASNPHTRAVLPYLQGEKNEKVAKSASTFLC
jgi:hypothetical protein